MERARTMVAGWGSPIAVAVVALVTALSPADLQPMAAGLSALAASALLAGWAVASGSMRDTRLAPVILAALAPAVALGASALAAADPRVSLLGAFGQHSGWALYASLALAAAWSLAGSGGRALSRVTTAGAVTGAVLAAAALAERAGLSIGAAKYSADPSGLLDNPTSLAQVLVIALACAVAWGLRARGVRRLPAVVAGALCAAGLLVAGVLGGFAGVAAGAVVALALLRLRPRTRRDTAAIGAGVALALALVLAAEVGVAVVPGDPAMRARLATASTGRTVIWAAATARAAARPVLGSGPDQFGVVQDWTGAPDGSLSLHTTSDPHSSLMGLAVGGGAIGLLAGVAAVGALAWALAEAHRVRGLPPAAAVLVGGAAGWLVSTALAWVYAPAALLAIAAAGPIAAGAADLGEDTPGRRPAAIAATSAAAGLAVAALAAAVWWAAVPAPIEARDIPSAAAPSIAVLAADTRAWPDPLLAARALLTAAPIAGTSADSAMRLADTAAVPSGYHADTAFRRLALYQAVGAAAGRDTYAAFASACAAGRRADPRSGLWDYALTLESLRLGRTSDAAAAARAALALPQEAENAAWLRKVAAGEAGLKLK